MDTTTAAQWPPQERVVKPMEEMMKGERKQKEAMKCPRCNSSNTKFCYYNNYSLSQPRYFCKTCRRYWTEGGSLRNIPVGGASRKNKNKNKRSSNSIISNTKLPDLVQNPKIRDSPPQDLNLAFANMIHHIPFSSSTAAAAAAAAEHDHLSSLELLTSRGLSSFMRPLPAAAGGFAMPELKPSSSSLNFSLDGYGSFQNNGKQLLFPFQDLKMQLPNNINQQNPDQNNNSNNNSTGSYWNGLIGGGPGGGSW